LLFKAKFPWVHLADESNRPGDVGATSQSAKSLLRQKQRVNKHKKEKTGITGSQMESNEKIKEENLAGNAKGNSGRQGGGRKESQEVERACFWEEQVVSQRD
jgi:hypothetical protein